MADEHKDIDAVTGTATTGHDWDGIRELNTPLPRWWLGIFYATIVWSIGYWIVYPAWPLLTDATKGVIGYASRTDISADMARLKAQRAARVASRQSTVFPHVRDRRRGLDPGAQHGACAGLARRRR